MPVLQSAVFVPGRWLQSGLVGSVDRVRSVSSPRFPQLWKTLWKTGRLKLLSAFSPDIAMDASIWDQVLTRVATKVNRHSFYTWFKPTSFVADGGSSITVRVPNPLFKDWLTKHYSVVLSEALAEVRRPDASLVFVAEGASVPVPVAEIPPPPDIDVAPVEAAPWTMAGLIPRYTFDTFIVG